MLTLQAIRGRASEAGLKSLADCVKYARTLAFQRKLGKALDRLESFFSVVKNPVVSCGGGKDSTAIAILARKVKPGVPIMCADPPNPLPDREEHVKELLRWLGGRYVRIPYPWDVGKVLAGEEAYPEGLKIRVLSDWQKEHGVDGVVLGIRAEESKRRSLAVRSRGAVYQMSGGWRCLPICDFTAEESLCVALMADAPINPVYTRQDGTLDFNRIHDGTWWPHDGGDSLEWMRLWYPDYAGLYAQALAVQGEGRAPICVF